MLDAGDKQSHTKPKKLRIDVDLFHATADLA